jgi:hypothetical protein
VLGHQVLYNGWKDEHEYLKQFIALFANETEI